MKNKFLDLLYEIFTGIPDLLGNVLIRESLQNKIIRMGGNDPNLVFQGFRNLRQRKFIKESRDGYRMTPSGLKWFNALKFKKLSITQNQKWDKKWRVVIFDIPEKMKIQRNQFRSKLKSLDFYLLQKSVFICPFPCEEELGFIANYLKIGDYVDIITADSIGFKEQEIRKLYGL